MAIKFMIKTTVSEMWDLPLALTKCNAQPIGMKTSRTFLAVSGSSSRRVA